jgi:hypothetical protein
LPIEGVVSVGVVSQVALSVKSESVWVGFDESWMVWVWSSATASAGKLQDQQNIDYSSKLHYIIDHKSVIL